MEEWDTETRVRELSQTHEYARRFRLEYVQMCSARGREIRNRVENMMRDLSADNLRLERHTTPPPGKIKMRKLDS